MRFSSWANSLTALLLTGTATAQGSVGGRLFECDLVWNGTLRSDGTVGQTDWTDLRKKSFDTFIFDEGSGVLRWKGADLAWQYLVMQSGTDENSMVAMRTLQGASAFVIDSLRIQTFVEGWPFLLIERDELSSGKCRKL